MTSIWINWCNFMALDTMDSTGRRATEACPLFPQCTMDAYKIWRSNLNDMHNKTSRNERSCLRYLPLFWPVRQSRAAVEHTLSLSQNKPISWCTYCYTYAQCSSYSIIERHGSKAKMVLSLLIPLILLLVCPF